MTKLEGISSKAAQEMRERVRRRLLERQDLDVVVIQAQVVPVTFQRGIAGLKVDETDRTLSRMSSLNGA